MDEWIQEKVVEPSRRLLEAMSVGDAVRDLEPCHDLYEGMSGLLWTEVSAQYGPWPGWTVEGLLGDACVKLSDHALLVFGMCFLLEVDDQQGDRFPVRAEICLDAVKRLESVTIAIGNCDATGAPPRLPQGSMLTPAHSTGSSRDAELLAGHRVRTLTWTDAVVYPLP